MKTIRNYRFLTVTLILVLTLSILCSCNGNAREGEIGSGFSPYYNYKNASFNEGEVMPAEGDTSDYVEPKFKENDFIKVSDEAVSTFSADVDTGSYTYFRKLVNSNLPAETLKSYAGAFRTEEFINYFKLDAALPEEGELFGVTTEMAVCPWNLSNRLLRLTLRTEEAEPATGCNLVFLIDVSGSMSSSDKLPLLKSAFHYLTDRLTDKDTVSIVTYSGMEKVALEGCPGNDAMKIQKALNELTANGSTNGEAGLTRAYEIAERYRIEGGNNRIILASDGDLNVGISSREELAAFVETKRESGIYLSVLGFGTGNYHDGNMETLADKGNGAYYYIDSDAEAEKIFSTDLFAVLNTVAEDVKLQITFNSAKIDSYRLIGYENRVLATEDFMDDSKDAGEVGAGHTVTVFYELIPATEETPEPSEGYHLFTLGVRYKKPGETETTQKDYTLGEEILKEEPSDDFLFLSAVIETAMFFHESEYLPPVTTISSIRDDVNRSYITDKPDRLEFAGLLDRLIND